MGEGRGKEGISRKKNRIQTDRQTVGQIFVSHSDSGGGGVLSAVVCMYVCILGEQTDARRRGLGKENRIQRNKEDGKGECVGSREKLGAKLGEH